MKMLDTVIKMVLGAAIGIGIMLLVQNRGTEVIGNADISQSQIGNGNSQVINNK